MPGETIDTLTLDIGLTSDEFQAGVNKILGSMDRMQGAAAETGESMSADFASLGSSVASLTWRFAGMFLAFKSIEGLVDYFKDLSRQLADVGFAAKYLGLSASELSRFGEVAKLAGGQSQDAIAGVRGLESAIFGLEFQGQISQNLMMLQRLGVAYLTSTGQMRDFKDIALDTAAALQKMLPGDANRAMRVQWAATVFGAGGLANAVGGGLTELRKFYSESARDQKAITDKTINAQMHLQQEITRLAYDVRSEAATILDRLTPTIEQLIHAIETGLIPTIDELIGDLMDWLHPGKMLDKASGGPTGWSPKYWINDLAHFGAMLGSDIADQANLYRKDKLAAISVPPQVTARLVADTNLDALKLLHMQSGGDSGDPTWSKAIIAYGALARVPEGPAGYVAHALAMGSLAPQTADMVSRLPAAHHLSTPNIPRWFPSATPGAGSKPTSSTLGPRVQIGTMNIATQATDANRMAADVNRALERKLLVAQADRGLA